jgi:gluconokinase
MAALVGRAITVMLRLAGPSRAKRIVGVGVSSFWHGLVAADESARALTPVYLWSDSRSRDANAKLLDRMDAEKIRLRTGCPIHPSYWPSKLAWLRAERPELWKRKVRWLSFGDLLYWRLFGRLGTSLSMASATGLFRLDDCTWDEELMAVVRVSPRSLPPIGAVEQNLTAAYARRWPALAAVPWMLALGDGALANLGSGCITPKRRALTIGVHAQCVEQPCVEIAAVAQSATCDEPAGIQPIAPQARRQRAARSRVHYPQRARRADGQRTTLRRYASTPEVR